MSDVTGFLMSFDNYWNGTRGTFKICKRPSRKPDFISRGRESDSKYWYGEDSRGAYVIREADHWSLIKKNGKVVFRDCKAIGATGCNWNLDLGGEPYYDRRLNYGDRRLVYGDRRRKYCGKVYLEDLQLRLPSEKDLRKGVSQAAYKFFKFYPYELSRADVIWESEDRPFTIAVERARRFGLSEEIIDEIVTDAFGSAWVRREYY